MSGPSCDGTNSHGPLWLVHDDVLGIGRSEWRLVCETCGAGLSLKLAVGR